MSDKGKVYWQSPAPIVCDLVGHVSSTKHESIADSGKFVDGRTTMGPWACMCMSCHRHYGVGLGTGKGQRYERQDDGRWVKTSF